MELADSEVGGSVRGASGEPVKRWSAVGWRGLEARGSPRASPGMGLRGAGAGFHTGYSRRLKQARD
jgi:hypothetical protein